MKTLKGLFLLLAIAAALPFQIKAQSFLTNGLVAYYPFHGNANDASGNGNNGTNYGATFVANRFGATNAAAHFNQSYILTGFFPPVGAAARTFSGWFQVPPSANAMTLLAYGGDSSYSGDRFELDMGYYIPGSFYMNGSFFGGWTSTAYDESNWHNFIMVVPEDAALSNAVVYMDGILQTNLILKGATDLFNTAQINPLQFGEEYLSGGFGPLTGSLSDVRIYNRALSADEAAQLYALESTPPIQITLNPTNTSVFLGQNTAFGVTATNSLPIFYQWYFNGSNSSSVASGYGQILNGFIYGVVITNGGYGYGNIPNVSIVGGGGSGAAGYATVSNGVVTGVIITNAGSQYSSAPSVVFDPPNGEIFGATNSVLAITNADADSVGNYYVVLSNSLAIVQSSMAALTVLFPPAISSEPQDDTVNAYGPASFSVTATGTAPLSYQWIFDSTNIPNATSNLLTVSSVTQSNLGTYSVVVTNDYGAITSSIANLYMYPYLENPFAGIVTYWGQTNTLSVGAWGSGDLSYQWYFNGAAISGATSSTLTLPAIQFTNSGTYSVVVSSSLGSVTNTPEQVVVNPVNDTLQLSATLVLQGTVGYTYSIQSTTNLSDTNSWVVETNLTLTQPLEYWTDTSVDVHVNQQKYYRILPGQ